MTEFRKNHKDTYLLRWHNTLSLLFSQVIVFLGDEKHGWRLIQDEDKSIFTQFIGPLYTHATNESSKKRHTFSKTIGG